MKKFLSVLLASAMVFSAMSTNVFAQEVHKNTDKENLILYQDFAEKTKENFKNASSVIGQSNGTSVFKFPSDSGSKLNSTNDVIVPGIVELNWTATDDSKFNLKIYNKTVKHLISFDATISTGNTTEKLRLTNLAPGLNNWSVYVPMLTFKETIRIYYGVTNADGVSYTGGNSTGLRQIPNQLAALWHSGTFASVEMSLNYHFGRHGSELGSKDILNYIRSADTYRKNLKGARTIKQNEPTPGYRYIKNGKYIDIAGDSTKGKILSYGKSSS